MNNSDVRIVELESMKIAFAKAKSTTPELDSWKMIKDFIDMNRLNNSLNDHPIFGIYDPHVESRRDEYEYECWLKLDQSKEYGTIDGVEIRDFPGGKFAVTTSNFEGEEGNRALLNWKTLQDWVIKNGHTIATGPHLEKPLNFDFSEKDLTLDLYLALE